LIRYHALGYIGGQFLLVFAVSLLLPLGVGLYYQDSGVPALAISAGIIGLVAYFLTRYCQKPRPDLHLREGIMLVVLLWVTVTLLGAIPFIVSPAFPTVADAIFESASGFTTTGATVLPNVEVLPPSIQLWRHFSHWLGGVGIILLAIAILPLLGMGGMALYKAQAGNIKSERLKPRVIETARSLWTFYVATTLLHYLALRWAGMNWFDSMCHTFSTMGTGGFSTRTASAGAFNSPVVEYVFIVFMIVASVNFTLHYRAMLDRSPFTYWRSTEFRFLLGTIAVCTAIITGSLVYHQDYDLERALRQALFQTTSLASTTGYTTDDYEQWTPFAQILLFLIGVFGGNTGSTAGGLKSFRVYVMLMSLQREFNKLIERRAVFAIRVGREVVPEAQVDSALSLFFMAVVFLVAAATVLAATGMDMLTAISAAAACTFSVGPGFGEVGPAESYANISSFAKLTLSVCMLAGRLEFFTLLLIFTPAYWRK
jgi:trk system potassium uptake protein TrkH